MKGRSCRLVLLGALSFVSVGGCGGPALVAETAGSTLAGVARVNIQGVDGDTLSFVVFSDSLEPVTVDRNAIYLLDQFGDRRKPVLEGGESKVTVAPGGKQEVRVRFLVDDLKPGHSVQIVFTDAISVNGRRLPMPSIRMNVPPDD